MTTRVLFVPGFMQRGEAWRPVADLLPERYPSVVLDHAQHTLAGRLEEIAAKGERCVLCGYSLGGRLALLAALRTPAAYPALVIVGAGAGIDEPARRAARADADERLAAWMETTPIDDVVSVWERQPLFADQSEALIEQQRPGRLSHDPRDLARLLRTAGQGVVEPFWHELLRLELPLLALAGAHDERYKAAARRIADLAPNARAAIVQDAGHAPQLQRPDAVAELVAGFLDAAIAAR